ncbi:putative membrane protein YiaA [Leucobacter luti]|uniref:inner membrane protein YiaA n=1 Tax=Leucobacter luti TaxID=340320 RepID=UPI00104E1565|nr:inner membrane protein YiaA [Leucobacter luti]MCW2288833.1 putative membrane protein YiaA [Leucobacter luti]TCK45016.1 putative membrane protein YiaA [Leucobacter luti]
MTEKHENTAKPTPAFVGASWVALLLGMAAYLIGLFNAGMELNEKGYYFALLMFGLFAAVSLQKTVRDRGDGLPVTNLYYGIAWFALVIALSMLAIGLWNAGSLTLSEKGFYGISFAMSLFASVAVQKNVRDLAMFKAEEDADENVADSDPGRNYLPGA